MVGVYQPWLRGWLCRHAVQTADADDPVQDVLAILYRELPGFRHSGRPGAFRTYLRGVLLNRLRPFHRHGASARGGGAPLAWVEQLADPGSELLRQWDHEHDQIVVKRLLERIAGDFEPRTWQAFWAVMIDARAAADVATELGISVGAFWSAKSWASGTRVFRLAMRAGVWNTPCRYRDDTSRAQEFRHGPRGRRCDICCILSTHGRKMATMGRRRTGRFRGRRA